jgi:PST family polysaccharide transporter
LIGTISGLGIGSSAVREVARAFGQEDAIEAARTARILRRACWGTGIFGWLLAVLLAEPISRWLFGSSDQATAIAILGVTLLLSSVSAGQLAFLQGLRRIGDIAKASVVGTLLSTVVAIALYAWIGKDGILPVLVTTAAINLLLSYWFSKRVHVDAADVTWGDTWRGTKTFLRLGLAFMWSSLLAAGLDALTRSIVTNQFGVSAAGIYQSAWALSGLFAGFILGAMGADYYPRLTAVIHDKAQAIRLVNEQTEIGILMALPGLLGTLAFAPIIMTLFYSSQFLGAAVLLPWMVLGVFGRVLCWPMGFILLAKGASGWVFVAETGFAAVQVALLYVMVDRNGLVGVAQAFAISYGLYIFAMLAMGRALIGFVWSPESKRLVLISSCFICAGFAIPLIAKDWPSIVGGGLVTLVGSIVSLRGLIVRLGPGSQLEKWISLLPGGRMLLPAEKLEP